jgi:mono/diheme cytochrome c family protein
MPGLSPKTAWRVGTAFPLLLGLAFLPGCGPDSYPEDLSYPPRTDPIVIKAPDTPITHLDPPGTLEQWIDSLPSRGGKLLDPTAGLEKQQVAKINEYLGKNHFDLTDEEARAIGLTSPPGKDTAKQELESRRDALQKQIKDIETKRQAALPVLTKTLGELFGTPAKPKVVLTDSDGDPINEPTLSEGTLVEGARLYRRHCLHCHGLVGDGRGPTGPWVNPHPRDYRQGEFKFTSSSQTAGLRKARREDLLRTLKQGIEGTSMPSFALLDEQKELEPLVSYIIHLSLRGQVELELLKALLGSDSDLTPEDVPDKAKERLARIWKTGWQQTQDKPINVAAAPSYMTKPLSQLSAEEKKQLDESIQRGFVSFTTGTAQCRSCHNDFGRANDYKYDDWGTIVRPANLTAGIYRGGRRPLDIYYRIHSGINGSGMPAFGDSVKPEEIWDIVNFLEAMPYPKMLPDEVREQIYGNKK